MIRQRSPIPRLRILKDLDSDEIFIGEWCPSLEEAQDFDPNIIRDGSFKFVLWEETYRDEDHAREVIKSTLYD